MAHLFVWFGLFGLAGLATDGAGTNRCDLSPVETARVCEDVGVSGFELIELILPPGDPETLGVDMVTRRGRSRLILNRHSLRAEGFTVQVDIAGRTHRTYSTPPVCTYRGACRGALTGRAAVTLSGEGLTGIIIDDDGELFGIRPLETVLPGAPAETHLIYRQRDLLQIGGTCGIDTPVGLGPGAGLPPGPASGTKICEVAFDADVEFFQKNNSSVDETVNDIETVMNGVDLVYERDTSISYELTTVLVRTGEPDPYDTTNPDLLLLELGLDWIASQGDVHRDTVHMMTGKNLDGSVIGIAQIGVICSELLGYGLSQSRFTGNLIGRVGLTAHELGHNWNARHCDGDSDCSIMCSTIGGCSGDATRFGVRSQGAVSSHRDSRGCLTDQPPALSIPFIETFPDAAIDPTHWTYIDGARVSRDGLGEPSPPYSLNLDATGPGERDDDEIRSNFIRLQDVALASLSYTSQHRGVEAGEVLLVEVWTSALRWLEVDRVVSDGSDQSTFDRHTVILPPEACHDRFRVRFRSAVSDTGDDWYLDDVQVAALDCSAPEPYGQPTPGTGDIVPQIDFDGGLPYPGNDRYTLVGTQLYGGETGFLLTGFSRVTVDLGDGLYLNVLPPWTITGFTVAGLPYPGYGHASIPSPIPADPGLTGVHFMNAFLCFDRGGPHGLIGTRGLDSTICGN